MEKKSAEQEYFLGESGKRYKIDQDGFILVGDIARGELKRQMQSIASFIHRFDPEVEHLGKGLRFQNVSETTDNYHQYMIHKDDVNAFIQRVKDYYKEI